MIVLLTPSFLHLLAIGVLLSHGDLISTFYVDSILSSLIISLSLSLSVLSLSAVDISVCPNREFEMMNYPREKEEEERGGEESIGGRKVGGLDVTCALNRKFIALIVSLHLFASLFSLLSSLSLSIAPILSLTLTSCVVGGSFYLSFNLKEL